MADLDDDSSGESVTDRKVNKSTTAKRYKKIKLLGEGQVRSLLLVLFVCNCMTRHHRCKQLVYSFTRYDSTYSRLAISISVPMLTIQVRFGISSRRHPR